MAKSRQNFSMIPNAAITDPNITHAQLRVLCAIAMHADEDGKCWPSQNRIAKMAGVTRITVNSAVKALVKQGYLISKRDKRDDGSRTSNKYEIVYDGKAGFTPPPPSTDTPPVKPILHREPDPSNKKKKQDSYAVDVIAKEFLEDLPFITKGRTSISAVKKALRESLTERPDLNSSDLLRAWKRYLDIQGTNWEDDGEFCKTPHRFLIDGMYEQYCPGGEMVD